MSSQPLAADAFRAEIRLVGAPPSLRAGDFADFFVRVRNASTSVWPTRGRHAIHLSYHWLDASGGVAIFDGRRTALPVCLEPGEAASVRCTVEAPERPGEYALELDLVQEDASWFRDRGSPSFRVACRVDGPRARHRLRFTGSASRAEFDAACAATDWWYHAHEFDNGYAVAGDYDVGRDVADYGFPEDMTGMTVLDVGTASGWFAHYFAERGAIVTATDIRGLSDYDVEGRSTRPPIEAEKTVPDRVGEDGRAIYHSRVSRGLWIMRELLGSNVRFVNARADELEPALFGGERFDLVFVGALLLHLRDPVGALMAARSVCRGRLVATTRLVDDDVDAPVPRMERVSPPQFANWWFPNAECYRRWFLDAGFARVDVERAVTLRGTAPRPSFEDPALVRNPTQRLRLADARV
jgi:SAM-dependent methyltransferase